MMIVAGMSASSPAAAGLGPAPFPPAAESAAANTPNPSGMPIATAASAGSRPATVSPAATWRDLARPGATWRGAQRAGEARLQLQHGPSFG